MTHDHVLYKDCEIKNYKGAQAFFARAKSPSKGRPFMNWGRVYKVGSDFVFYVYDIEVCRITPDDVLVMSIDAKEGKSRSNSLSIVLHRFVPVSWQRARTNCYRILGIGSLHAGEGYWDAAKKAPELFKGLMFDLKTGLPLNARPDLTDRVNKDARREWVRALGAFKRGIKVRAKLGVFTTIAQDIVAKRAVNAWPVPRWDTPEWSNMLYKAIRDTQFPTTLLQGIVLTSNIRWTAKIPTPNDAIRWTDSLLDNKSIELRTRFGVFEGETL
jgi:hypothetical protein